MTLAITAGGRAFELIGDAAFRATWESLWLECPWATAYQAPGFVCTWYEVYREQYRPLLIHREDEQGNLTAMLPLAIKTDGSVVPAGAEQSEYKAWISRAEGDTFIRDALVLLRKAHPDSTLLFEYLPPGTPLKWCEAGDAVARSCTSATYARPVLRFDDVSAAEEYIRGKKRLRTKLNRLGALGTVRLRQLTELAELDALLPWFSSVHDLRRGGKFGQPSFAADPTLRAFCAGLLQDSGVFHATALYAGDQVIAAHFGVAAKGWCHLGISAHSPVHDRYSPGMLLLIQLVDLLARQGYTALDLTPGDDPYKSRFATDWDTVQQLVAHSSVADAAWSRASRALTGAAKTGLRRIGLTPEKLRRRQAGHTAVPLSRPANDR